MDMQVVVTLLTICIALLTVIVVGLLTVVVVLLIKVRRIATNVETVMRNASHVTEWMSPTKVFSEAVRAFRRR